MGHRLARMLEYAQHLEQGGAPLTWPADQAIDLEPARDGGSPPAAPGPAGAGPIPKAGRGLGLAPLHIFLPEPLKAHGGFGARSEVIARWPFAVEDGE